MLNTTKTMLAIASLLTVSATAMAAPAVHRVHRLDTRQSSAMYDARAQAGMRYAPSASAFEPNYGGPQQTLFGRAKGNIE